MSLDLLLQLLLLLYQLATLLFQPLNRCLLFKALLLLLHCFQSHLFNMIILQRSTGI